MPRMTTDLIARCTGQAKRRRDEDQDHFLRRITHLHCAEKGIEKIEGLSLCHNLSVLYLYDNLISVIENLEPCLHLTHLYLQNNNISYIANLSVLRKLSKLYLSYNALTVVEGLENLKQLSELHIAHQKFPHGEQLLFDPRSLHAIAGSLCVLNVSGNNLDSIEDLQCLTNITYFSACDNRLNSMKVINYVFSQWRELSKVELAGNPLCQKHKYRDRVVTMGSLITSVDGREVSETEKIFLMKWKALRKARKKQQKESISSLHTDLSSIPKESSTKDAFYSAPIQPLTLPALPARQLPRRSKKKKEPVDEPSAAPFTLPRESHFMHDLLKPYGNGMRNSEALRFPEIVPHQSIITQKRSLFNSALNKGSLAEKPLISHGITARIFE